VTEKVFPLLEVAKAVRLPGVMDTRAEFDLRRDARGELVMSLRAYVLTEPAGETAVTTRTVTWQEVRRPRWLPKFAWRRLRREARTEVVHLRVQPLWVYPHSSVAVPRLGEPVRLWTSDPAEVRWAGPEEDPCGS